jgi:urease accessory protein
MRPAAGGQSAGCKWRRDQSVVASPPAPAALAARSLEARLRFAVGGGRTILAHQRIAYPLHVTRPFHLDMGRQDLATLYLQSASGGLYAGDRLALAIEVMPHAAVHVTTPASTIVHDTRGLGAEQTMRLTIGRGAFAAVTPEPLVLFPGASMASQTEIILESTARGIVADGFFSHDPRGEGRVFHRCTFSTVVCRLQGQVLSVDRGAIDGGAFCSAASPLGRHRAVATMLVLGTGADRLAPADLEAALDRLGCLAAISPMPNDVGVAVRILGPEGGALARGLQTAFALAFTALLGVPAARRRK